MAAFLLLPASFAVHADPGENLSPAPVFQSPASSLPQALATQAAWGTPGSTRGDTPPALAAGNFAGILQYGSGGLQGAIVQNANGARASIAQQGAYLEAEILQSGGAHSASLLQSAIGSADLPYSASIVQYGPRPQSITITQTGPSPRTIRVVQQ